MAKYDLKYFKYCTVTETEAADGTVSETLGTGAVLARAVKASVSFRTSKAKLFADGGLAESVNQFTDGTVSLDVDDLDAALEATLTGASESSGEYTLTDESTAPYIRLSYIAVKIVRHVTKYVAYGYRKVVLDIPNDEEETKGESINLRATTINGDIAAGCDGGVRKIKSFDTLAAAEAWQKTFCNFATQTAQTGTGA